MCFYKNQTKQKIITQIEERKYLTIKKKLLVFSLMIIVFF